MIDPPQITYTQAQTCAIIRLTNPMADMTKVVPPAINELMSLVKAQGIGPASAWYIYVHKMEPARIDFEVGVPVTVPVKPTGRLKSGGLPAAKVARTVHHGGYEGLAAAWGQLNAWIKANGHKPGDPVWDVYLAGPETGSDSTRWRTQLNRPLLG